MSDFLIFKYNNINDKYKFLRAVKFYSIYRFLLKLIAITFVPIWFKISNLFKIYKLSPSTEEKKVIVSLTTFPKRISIIWIVIECMLRQSVLPDKIILWLSKDQFSGLNDLPKSLLKLQKRGLEVKFCEGDLKSHKKYYYALKNYTDDIIITIDDDLFYPSYLVSDLLELHNNFPDSICCHRASKYKTFDGKLLSYKEWDERILISEPTLDIFFTTGGGTLFPPNCFSGDVLKAEVFMEICKYADDVWLNLLAQFNKTRIVKIQREDENIMPILIIDNIELHSVNVTNDYNDIQFQNVVKYLKGIKELSWGVFNF
ncbi:glycosyl transferase [Flavobacterium sp. YO64]|uniref:glycosyl transferase n=1 Tax=Flavobacterium sp. YO64 TaxID=394559 RepID=UPI00100AAA85|nr:glycosyl transferase [Flavobacterium sp. YO64]RXM43990.1 hypothetical protein BOW57_10485 [Flavobacterium sp. YO64]